MSTPARPSTPLTHSPSFAPQTGTWRHPKLDEIVKRRDASNFSDRNLKKVGLNAAGGMVTFYLSKLLGSSFPTMLPNRYTTYAYWLLLFVFGYNMVVACLPLFRSQDDIADIPLTPAQRKLFGLPPSSTPPTPGSQYVTPPRYARTPSSSPASKATPSRSPSLKKSGSTYGGTLFSPNSPMLQKAIGGDSSGNRRSSYGSPSPLGPSFSRMSGPETPGTPTPAAAKGVNVGLNSKWLYEKGRRNSGSARLYT